MAEFWGCITSEQQKDKKRLIRVIPYILQASTREEAKRKFKELWGLHNFSQAICSPITQEGDFQEAIRVVRRRIALLENGECSPKNEIELVELATTQKALEDALQKLQEHLDDLLLLEVGEGLMQ